MFLFLLIVQTLVAIALITVILMQRSEGGGLTSGGGNSSLMTARGAADFLTRATTVLAAIFIVLSIVLAALARTAAGPARSTPMPRAAEPTSGGQLGSAQPPGSGTGAAGTFGPARRSRRPGLPPPSAPAAQGQAPAALRRSPRLRRDQGQSAGGVPIAQ
jgi:preprotein translocase subunit SecG